MNFPKLAIRNYKAKIHKKDSPLCQSSGETKYEIALKISNVGLWDWDIVTNKVFYSEESKNIIGYSGAELKNTSIEWDEKVHPDDKELYYSNFDLHLKGELELYEFEYRILCKDGNQKWILDKGKVIERNSNGKPSRIIGKHTDITYIKKVRKPIKKQSSTYN